MSLRLTRVSLEHVIFYKSDLELCCLYSDAVTADLEPGLRYSIHKQVTSSAGWITISNQHKWKGQKWVIHQPDNVDQNQNNRKVLEFYSHNDHDIPLKTTNCVHLVSSWNAFPEMNFSNKNFRRLTCMYRTSQHCKCSNSSLTFTSKVQICWNSDWASFLYSLKGNMFAQITASLHRQPS